MALLTTPPKRNDYMNESDKAMDAVQVILRNPTAPVEALKVVHASLLKGLAVHGTHYTNVSQAVKLLFSHPNLPVDLMDTTPFHEQSRGAASLHSEIALAENPSLPEEMARDLYGMARKGYRSENYHSYASHLLLALMGHSIFTYEDLETVQEMVKEDGLDMALPRYPGYPEHRRDQIIESYDDWHLQEAYVELANNPTLSEKHVREMAKSSDYLVMQALAYNRRTPSDVLYSIHRYSVKVSGGYINHFSVPVLQNPSLSSEALRAAYAHTKGKRLSGTDTIRKSIAKNPNAPEEIVLHEHERINGADLYMSHRLSDDVWAELIDYVPRVINYHNHYH